MLSISPNVSIKLVFKKWRLENIFLILMFIKTFETVNTLSSNFSYFIFIHTNSRFDVIIMDLYKCIINTKLSRNNINPFIWNKIVLHGSWVYLNALKFYSITKWSCLQVVLNLAYKTYLFMFITFNYTVFITRWNE